MEDLKYMEDRLKFIDSYNLIAEVLATAIKIGQENPDYSVAEVFQASCYEWEI